MNKPSSIHSIQMRREEIRDRMRKEQLGTLMATERTIALIRDAVEVETKDLKEELEIEKKKGHLLERKISRMEEEIGRIKSMLMTLNI
jgi:predicted transcriptional regulator